MHAPFSTEASPWICARLGRSIEDRVVLDALTPVFCFGLPMVEELVASEYAAHQARHTGWPPFWLPTRTTRLGGPEAASQQRAPSFIVVTPTGGGDLDPNLFASGATHMTLYDKPIHVTLAVAKLSTFFSTNL